MDTKEIINYLEDKDIKDDSYWFLHATENDIKIIDSILKEGIKSAYLRNDNKSTGFNGKYYISLFQNNYHSTALCKRFENNVKFIIDDIRPYYVVRESKIRYFFINTRIPLRTSEYDGEYQQYLKIDSSKFVGIDYHLSRILLNLYKKELIKELDFMKELVYVINENNNSLPIYDLSSHKEINKDKLLSLKL